MKQTIAERRLHHQTREDRQLKAYEACLRRIQDGVRYIGGGNWHPYNVEAAAREAEHLRRKLNIEN